MKALRKVLAAAAVITMVAAMTACGSESAEEVREEEHKHVYGIYLESKAATCEEGGEETAYCICGASDIRETEPLGHQVEGFLCEERKCMREGCGYIEAAGEHTYEYTKIEATCEEAGYSEYFCVCGVGYMYLDEEKKGHVWKEWETEEEATCEQTGLIYRECTECGAKEYEVTEKTEHKYEKAEETLSGCTSEGYILEICSVCGEERETYTEATGHTWEKENTVPPTCTEDGYTTYRCGECGAEEKREVTERLGHIYAEGYEKTPCVSHECLRTGCGHMTKAMPHTPEEIQRKEATCTEGENILYRCGVCGVEYKENISEPNGHDMERDINSCDLTCTKCGYKEEREHTLTEKTKEPACTEEGYRKTVCTECGYTVSEEILQPTGHTFDEETSCGEYTCMSCGAQKTIPHEFGEYISDNNGSCTLNGTMTAKCNNCTVTDTKEEPDSATGHTGGEASCTRLAICAECGESYGKYAEHIPTSYPETLPGCETAGSMGGTYCSECLVTIAEPVSLPPTGHTFANETDCGEYICTSCGAQKTIPHEYTSTTYPATCMEEGYTLRECIHCGDTYKTDITAKGDHTYDNYGICECGRISGVYFNYTVNGEWLQKGEAKTAVISFYETEIPVMAFYYNTDIEEVYCGAYMATICDYAFDGCTSLKRIYVPVACNISPTALPQGVQVIRVEYD